MRTIWHLLPDIMMQTCAVSCATYVWRQGDWGRLFVCFLIAVVLVGINHRLRKLEGKE